MLTLQQFPQSGPPPTWAPQQPEQDQAPPSPAADPAAQPPAPSSGGFAIDVGSWHITGWHAVVVIAAGLAAVTLLQVWGYANTTAAVNAFDRAPLCYGNKVEAGCKTSALMWLSVVSTSSHCYLQAHPQTTRYPYYSGEFSPAVCGAVKEGSHAFVEIWQGSLVHVTGLAGVEWATNSAVGKRMSTLFWIAIMLVVDAGFALIVALYFVSWVMGRRRSAE